MLRVLGLALLHIYVGYAPQWTGTGRYPKREFQVSHVRAEGCSSSNSSLEDRTRPALDCVKSVLTALRGVKLT